MRSTNWFSEALSIFALNFRGARARPLLPTIMVIGFLAVVLVMVTVLSIGQGLAAMFSHTGADDVAMVLANGPHSETTSHLSQTDVQALASLPGIVQTPKGPLVSAEFVTTTRVAKRDGDSEGYVMMRGVTPAAFRVHDHVHVIKGRHFKPGVHETIVGRQAARQYRGLQLGDTFQTGNVSWKVVGIFAANGGLRESEIWADAAGLQTALNAHNSWSDVYAKLTSPAAYEKFATAAEDDPRLNVDERRESAWFGRAAQAYKSAVDAAGTVLAILMAIGAVIGAVNLIFTSLSARVGEIATLRAVGFRRLPVLVAVLLEALAFGLVGGVIGGGIAYAAFNGYQASTAMSGFTQIAFQFAVTPGLLIGGIVFALIMGFFGGLFPAIRAARLPITRALREA